MTNVNFYQGNKPNLPPQGTDNGSLYITNDTGELFKSIGNGQPLVKVGDILTGYADLTALQSVNPALTNKLYITDNNKVYKYNGTNYVELGSSGSIIYVIDYLTSTSTSDALSANMGRELKDMIDTKAPNTTVTTTVDGLMLSTDKAKLDGIEEGANNYTLPTATNTVLGGVKVDGSTITADENGVISAIGTVEWDTF